MYQRTSEAVKRGRGNGFRIWIGALMLLGGGLQSVAAQRPAAHVPVSPPHVPVSLSFSRQYQFVSRINHRAYRIMVALPVGYGEAGDTAHYPVLYVLDGNDQLPMAAGMARYLRMAAGGTAAIPGLIVVGVGYPVDRYDKTRELRATDYTPTNVPVDSAGHAPIACCPEIVTGGGPAMLRVFREEIIPRTEREFRTTTDRGIMGHSLGGLFAAFALFEAPDLFNRYAILSPSLWWDNGLLFQREEAFAKGRTELAKHVFLAAGELETNEFMVQPMKRMTSLLQSRNYKGLQIESMIFPNETHLTVIPFAIARAIRVLYYSPSS